MECGEEFCVHGDGVYTDRSLSLTERVLRRWRMSGLIPFHGHVGREKMIGDRSGMEGRLQVPSRTVASDQFQAARMALELLARLVSSKTSWMPV